MSNKKRSREEQRRGVKSQINSVGEMIRSLRLSKSMTQVNLSKAIGSYAFKNNVNIIQRYEKGPHLPDIHFIYMLSKVLEIDREPFFNMVLKEHYNRLVIMNHEKFFLAIKRRRDGKSILSDNVECKYSFCTYGKIKHNFSKSSIIFKNAFLKKSVTYKKMAFEIKNSDDKGNGYSSAHLFNIINGKRVPSLKIVFDLCDYFELALFKMYKIIVEEKVLAHAKNMMLQWELHKEGIRDGTEDIRI